MKSSRPVAFLATCALLAATLAATQLTGRRRPESLARPLSEIDLRIDGWETVRHPVLDPRDTDRLKPTSTLSRIYQKDNRQLGLFVAFYAQQRAGETMHSPKQCLPGAGWEIWRHGSVEAAWDGRRVDINRYSIQRATQRMVVFYWYQSRSRVVASEYLGKILLVRDALFEGRTGGALVRITLPDTPGATTDGVRFASALMPLIHRSLSHEAPTP